MRPPALPALLASLSAGCAAPATNTAKLPTRPAPVLQSCDDLTCTYHVSPPVDIASPVSLVATQDDICALINLTITRLGTEDGERADASSEEKAVAREATENVRFRQDGLRFSGSWGRCRVRVPRGQFTARIDSIRLSPDHSAAVVAGGWIIPPLSGSGGECHLGKAKGSWRLLGCINSWAV